MNRPNYRIPLSIRRPAVALVLISMFSCVTEVVGQTNQTPQSTTSKPSPKDNTSQPAPSSPSSVEILSDTQGIDFGPYLRQILTKIRQTWIPLIPTEARPPINTPGETKIRFQIAPDGKLLAMHLDARSHNENIDRAAWGAITDVGQFPPLPAAFTGPYLELRINFLVNLRPPTTPQPAPPPKPESKAH